MGETGIVTSITPLIVDQTETWVTFEGIKALNLN